MQRYIPPGLLLLHHTTTTTTTTTTMNFINKGIMTGRAKLSRIIHVKPCQLNDEKNKENIDISKPKPPRSPHPSKLSNTKLPSSLTNSIEDVFVESQPSKSTPSANNRRSRSLDRITTSGTSSSDRRNSYFDVRHHTHIHSLGSQQELAPVFTTTYRTVFSTLNTPTTTMNGSNKSYSNSSKNSLSNGSVGGKFKTAEFTFQKSPVKRRAKW